MRKVNWLQLTTEEFKGLDPEKTIAILPIAAIEQHGPHLAVSTDTVIGQGMVDAVIARLPQDLSALMRVVARELRVKCQMLVVTTGWRFGVPKGLFTDQEALHGIHAGDIETSLMLHLRPDLVRKEKVQNFVPSSVRMENEFKFLRPTGLHGHAWIAQDIHPAGAAGDASLATAEKGRQWAEFQAERFIELLRDVEKFELARLA